jgi:subtilisin
MHTSLFRYRAITWRIFVCLVLVAILGALQSAPVASLSPSHQALQLIESDAPPVIRIGSWSYQASSRASGGGYLYSSGGQDDALVLHFTGAVVEVIYVQHRSLGTLAIEVDGVVLRTVNTRSTTTSFDQRSAITYLDDKAHVLRVYGVDGPVAIDAFVAAPYAKPDLRTKALQEGSVRVIVQLRTAFRVESALTAAEVQQQRAAINQARQTLASQLASYNVQLNVNSRDWIIPYMALRVDVAALDFLTRSPLVADVMEDELAVLSLAETIPIIDADLAWALGYEGAGQAVAILDTGLEGTHSFFGGRVVAEACFSNAGGAGSGVTLCPNGTPTQTGVGASSPAACAGVSGCDHGTHVGGIAAGNGSSFDGVARNGNLIGVIVFTRFNSSAQCGDPPNPTPCVLSYTSDQISGLNHVYSLRSTHAIASANMSLGGSGPFSSACDSDSRKAIIDSLRAAGIATVIASGNNGFNNGVSAPGCISTAITVGATTDADTVATFSNSHALVDVLAPGVNVQSSVTGNAFGSKSGTSMAAPHVAGAWALLKSAKPSATVDEVETALESTGVSITDPDNSVTKPRIDLDDAVNVLVPSGTYYPEGTISDGDPYYEWTAVSGATWYNLQVIDNSNGATIYNQWHEAVAPGQQEAAVCSGGQCVVNIAAILTHNGSYTWRFQGWGPSIGFSGWNGPHNFTVNQPAPTAKGTPISPIGTYTGTSSFTYQWNKVANAVWYHLLVRRASNNAVVIDLWYRGKQICDASTCSANPGINLGTGGYNWFVQTWGLGGFGPWNDGATFVVIVSPPVDAAVLIAPSGTIADNTPTYTWNVVYGATLYRLYVGGPVIIDQIYSAASICSGATCAVTPGLNQPNGNYTFWVQGQNSYGGGPWSSGKSFTIYTPPIPPVVQIAPNGTIGTNRPTFTWQDELLAYWYHVWAGSTSGATVVDAWYYWSDVCAGVGGTCTALSPNVFNPGNYQWWIIPWSPTLGYGIWNGPMLFTVTSATGWVQHSGAWYYDSYYLFTNPSASEAWSSVSYAASTYSNFDYRARLWRTGCNVCSNAVMVRGTPSPLGIYNRWSATYLFNYTSGGQFSVWRWNSDGTTTMLQGWTFSSAIYQGATWNELRVVANGSSLYYYINGTLVWSGVDSTFSSGRVGIGMFRGSPNNTGNLWVDWAVLSVLGGGGLEISATLSPAQQALNDAANANPAGSPARSPAGGLPSSADALPPQAAGNATRLPAAP